MPSSSSSSSSSSVGFPRRAQQKSMGEEEEEEYSRRRRHETIDDGPSAPSAPDDHRILLPEQSNTQGAANTTTGPVDPEDGAPRNKAFDVENRPATRKGKKMDAVADKTPLLDQKGNREDELEYMSNFAFLLSMLSYGVLYLLGSAKLGRKGSNTRLVMCLHAWTAVMMLLLFVGSYIRWPAAVLKIMRLVMAGVIFISALVIFILAHCAP